jgi:hypothetical protein
MLLEFNDSDIRDGWIGVLELGSGRRITDQLSGQLGLGYEVRQAFDGQVFDLENYRLSGSLSYAPLSPLRFFAVYSMLIGETASTTVPNAEIIDKSHAREPDNAFGGGAPGGPAGGRVAYQLDAVTHQFELGGNYRMASDLSLDVSARYTDVNASGDISYYDWSVSGGLNWHY